MSDGVEATGSGGLKRLRGASPVAVLVLAIGSWALTACGSGDGGGGGDRPPAATDAPNIILVVTDDQPLASFNPQALPTVFSEVVEPGTNFSEAAVAVPLCCPSRATMITGQYAHNHGIFDNDPGYETLRDPGQTLPVWLQQAGYLTGHFGKWLHGYEDVAGADPAPGWDRWVTQLEPRLYYDYELSIDGEVRSYGGSRRDYLTKVISDEASSWVRRRAGERPLYVQLDFYAPHGAGPHRKQTASCRRSAEPPLADFDAADAVELPSPPSYNEADVSDKPGFYQELPPLTDSDTETIEEQYRCAVASLAAADRGFADLLEALRETGELEDTAFIFVSDNGYFLGEHRMGAPQERNLKQRPLEPTIHVPLALRLPAALAPGPVPSRVDLQVSLADIAPTVLELAGAEPCVEGECRVIDGRSLVGLASGERRGWPRDRAVLFEYDAFAPDVGGPTASCAYAGLRTAGSFYVRHTEVPGPDGCGPVEEPVIEYYDLLRDPFQLENLAGADPRSRAGATEEQLAERLDALIECAGSDEAAVRPCE